jgi:hypothetical protein
MLTNYSQAIAASPMAGGAREELTVFDRLRQAMCGLHGHDSLVQFEHDRMFLRCVSCGHETHGWELNDVRPPVTVREAHRTPMPRPQLVGERRLA